MLFRRCLAACALACVSLGALAAPQEAPAPDEFTSGSPAERIDARAESPRRSNWAIEFSGVSHHWQAPTGRYPIKKWNQQNWGLGLEYRKELWPGYRLKATAGIMYDSTYFWSKYAGAVLQKRWTRGDYAIDAGAGAFFFYRGLETGAHDVVAGPLPVLSIEHLPTGVGVNFSFIPYFKTPSVWSPATLFVQGFVAF